MHEISFEVSARRKTGGEVRFELSFQRKLRGATEFPKENEGAK